MQVDLETARASLESLVRFASQTYPEAEIAVGGFSQGATVSSLLLAEDHFPIRHMILYSPALAIGAAKITPRSDLHVLLAHGQRDEVLPYEDSDRLLAMLGDKQIETSWHPFDDGHTISTELLNETRRQLSQDGD